MPPQPSPLTPAQLRSQLEVVLADDLGTFEDGSDAIWVSPPNPPPGQVTGLQCIISRVSVGGVAPGSANQYHEDLKWRVVLTNFDDTDQDYNRVYNAKKKIQAAYYPYLLNEPIYLAPSDQAYEQCSFELCVPSMVNA